MTTYTLNDAVVDNEISNEIFDRGVSIAHGAFREDKNFTNRVMTVEALLTYLSTFGRGVKDGACILQGSVVDPPSGRRGVRRIAENMSINSIMMFDHDTGDSVDEVVAKIRRAGLFAVVWTTHSHLKQETMVPEASLHAWLKTRGIHITGSTEPDHALVIDFLRDSQKMHDNLLTDATVLGRELIEGGRKYRVRHAPLPRLRSLFLLKEPFNFATRPGSQKQAITEWKTIYAAVCAKFDLPTYDKKCTDPSRLMYTPRIGDDADKSLHTIRVITGNMLDLEGVKPATTTDVDAIAAVFKHAGTRGKAKSAGAGNDFRTPGLAKFLAVHGHDFEAETWLKSVDIDMLCPFHEHHTPAENGIDTGFKAWDASSGDGNGFNMQCSHSCGADPGRGQGANGKQDRGKYLDALCVAHKVVDANDLVSADWTPHAEEEAEARAAKAQEHLNVTEAVSTEINESAGGLEGQIDAINKRTTEEQIKPILQALSALTNELAIDGHLTRIARISNFGKLPLKREVKRMQNERNRAAIVAAGGDPDAPAPGAGMIHHTIPDDLGTADIIWRDWPLLTQKQAAQARLERAHAGVNPRIFSRPEGGTVRVKVGRDGRVKVEELYGDAWLNELSQCTVFRAITQLGEDVEVATPIDIQAYVKGAPDFQFPMLQRVVRVPVFSKDGALLTTPGYNPELETYLDPSITCLPIHDKIEKCDLEEALYWLRDALIDFPFSDTFDGSDTLPIKWGQGSEEKLDAFIKRVQEVRNTSDELKKYLDRDDWPLPHPDRGVSSFANMLALILQPFVQHLITGNCPAYHIDKASPGTGANYLVDVVACISEGRRAVVRTMSSDNEEFRKTITAMLRKGSPLIFLDNINHKIVSGDLAAVLTSGIWAGRILGHSEETEFEVACAWVLAGNNLSFSNELMRRNVPIRLDAATANPALDRKQETFKHYPMQDWLLENRGRLIWACHILIANWIDGGMKPGTVTFNSFDGWARVLGGILEAAGVQGFLANIPDYLEAKNDDGNSLNDFAAALFCKYPVVPFTADDALSVAKNPMLVIQFGLPIDPSAKEHAQIIKLGSFLKAHMDGKTFEFPTKSDPTLAMRVKLVAGKVKGQQTHRFQNLGVS